MSIDKSIKSGAIISTYDQLCGIAGFTKQLVKNLSGNSGHLNIKVFDLDQMLLRLKSRRGRKIGDDIIKDMAVKISSFDHLNIQLEYGTLGYYEKDIVKRFRLLCASSKSLSVTFHTIKDGEDDGKVYFFKRNKIISLQSKIINILRKLQNKKDVSIIVHSNRDARYFNEVLGIKYVYHHPLSFYSLSEVNNILSSNNRDLFPQLACLDNSTIVVGVFGFFSSYKGIEVAINAIELLPKNYILAIFGGLHPNSIKNFGPGHVDPYLSQIISSVHAGEKFYELLSDNNIQVSNVDFMAMSEKLSIRDLSKRVQFVGALNDEMFPAAVAACDVCLFPYYEVGQASSGPISIANEIGVPIIASRTKAFMRFERYHPDRVSFFDVGNHVHLSQIVASISLERKKYPQSYELNSLCELYKSVFFRSTIKLS